MPRSARRLVLVSALVLLGLVPARAATSEVSLRVPGAVLRATLQTPDGVTSPPVVLILGGSGPTDRDGNSPAGVRESAYRKLADALSRAGYATLRPDKRGVAGSATPDTPESALTFGDLVQDARAWMVYLNAQRVYGPLVVAGHSEGALVGLAALQAAQPGGQAAWQRVGLGRPEVLAFVSLDGPGETLGATIRRQLTENPANPPALVSEADTILSSLERGQPVVRVSPPLAPLFRPSVQPYLMSELTLDPLQLIGALRLPVLVVQGGRDLQVPASDAQALVRAAPQATLLLVPGMNHLLVDAPADRASNVATYTRSDLPLSAAMLRGLLSFLGKLTEY